ncbi:MAG: acyl carrier protein [Lachnospiraceae bacterium]|nr:acyl carrier protein [Lachnospiraceae bacterium]MCR4611222.1 acyl carrier protein [Lachnospiraceae bacterium]
METKETIIEILEEIRPDVEFENETSLVDGNVLESFDIVSLVSELSDEFDITIRPKDLVPENFNSVDAMTALVEKLMDE